MKDEINSVISQLQKNVNSEDFLDYSEDQVDLLREIDSEGASIDGLLMLIEDHPEIDFGMPGPIVHFVEQFFRNGYENKLLQSIRRNPVPHTLWMLNRIINGTSGDEQALYVDEMKCVLKRSDLDEATKLSAKEFLDF